MIQEKCVFANNELRKTNVRCYLNEEEQIRTQITSIDKMF